MSALPSKADIDGLPEPIEERKELLAEPLAGSQLDLVFNGCFEKNGALVYREASVVNASGQRGPVRPSALDAHRTGSRSGALQRRQRGARPSWDEALRIYP